MYKETLNQLIARYPAFKVCENDIVNAFQTIKTAFEQGNKLLLAGNGGSAADCEHIAGELLKSFTKKRPINTETCNNLKSLYGPKGEALSNILEGALPAISLPSLISIGTAFSNDKDPTAVFAQLTYGLGAKGDVLLGISTSGNAENIISAFMVAHAKGVKTIGLTGNSCGKMIKYCDIAICAPSDETHVIQEFHLPIYHALCAMLEAELF